MKQCVHIDAYLDGALAKELRPDFENHLLDCPHCQAQADEWQYIRESLMEWGNDRELPAPGPAKTSELLLALRPTAKKNLWPRYALGALPIAASIVLAMFFVFQSSTEEQSFQSSALEQYKMSVLHSDRSEVQLANDLTGDQLTVAQEGSLLVGVGPDRLGVGSQSRVEVLQANSRKTEIKLHRGKVAVEVDPKRKNRNFAVLAGDIQVKVVGTRFSVTMDQTGSSTDVTVAVQRGKVVVEGPRQTSHVVRKGQTLVIGQNKASTINPIDEQADQMIAELLSLPTNDIMEFSEDDIVDSEDFRMANRRHHAREDSSDPEKWRSWILEGKYGVAERAITDHLRMFPTDTESWSLLATCRRKTKQWRGALNAYQKIVEIGNSKAANTARFEMARILQDRLGNHGAAAEVLSEYLRTPRLLEAEAMVRLGRARLKQGRTKEATEIWTRVTKRFRGTSAAMHAQNLLEKAESEGNEDAR